MNASTEGNSGANQLIATVGQFHDELFDDSTTNSQALEPIFRFRSSVSPWRRRVGQLADDVDVWFLLVQFDDSAEKTSGRPLMRSPARPLARPARPDVGHEQPRRTALADNSQAMSVRVPPRDRVDSVVVRRAQCQQCHVLLVADNEPIVVSHWLSVVIEHLTTNNNRVSTKLFSNYTFSTHRKSSLSLQHTFFAYLFFDIQHALSCY